MSVTDPLRLHHHAFGRDLLGGDVGRVDLGGDPPDTAEVSRATQLVLDHLAALSGRPELLVLEPDGGCVWARTFPASADANGRPTRRYHVVWLDAGQLAAVGYRPWRLAAQLPNLTVLGARLGTLGVDPVPCDDALGAPKQFVDALALAARVRAGEPIELHGGAADALVTLVWLALLSTPGGGPVHLTLTDSAARFAARRPAPPPPPAMPVRATGSSWLAAAALWLVIGAAAGQGLVATGAIRGPAGSAAVRPVVAPPPLPPLGSGALASRLSDPTPPSAHAQLTRIEELAALHPLPWDLKAEPDPRYPFLVVKLRRPGGEWVEIGQFSLNKDGAIIWADFVVFLGDVFRLYPRREGFP